jgi:hypothetical protein
LLQDPAFGNVCLKAPEVAATTAPSARGDYHVADFSGIMTGAFE